MKTIRRLAIMLLSALMPMAVSAQDNLKKAIADFTTDSELMPHLKKSYSTETSLKSGAEVMSYYKTYSFNLPSNKRKKLDKVLRAFDMDQGVAYKVMARDADINAHTLSSVAYGEELDKSISFGSHKDRNYRLMFVRDREDSLRRYVYALWWTDKEDDDLLKGEIQEIYSPDPQKREKKAANLAEMIENAVNEVNVDSKDFVINDGLEGKIKDGRDFLQRFTTLRSIYFNPKVYRWLGGRTVIINKVLDHCRQYGKLASKEEREVCAKGIQSMIRSANDSYERELLNLAIDSLDH